MDLILRPLTMRRFNSEGVYAPSRLRRPQSLSYEAFLARYADYPGEILVSFAPDGFSRPERLTAYSPPGLLGSWTIVEAGD
jgi:hypothetical protein